MCFVWLCVALCDIVRPLTIEGYAAGGLWHVYYIELLGKGLGNSLELFV